MGKHKNTEPKNTEFKDAMQIRHPDWTFAICEVCHNWCVVLEDIEGGFHPLCTETSRYRTIMYARRREANKGGLDSLF